MDNWRETTVTRKLRSSTVLDQLELMKRQAMRETKIDRMTLSTQAGQRPPISRAPLNSESKQVQVPKLKIKLNSQDIEEETYSARRRKNSQIVAMIIFERNNRSKKADGLHTYFKEKTEKSWFFYAYGNQTVPVLMEKLILNKLTELNDRFTEEEKIKKEMNNSADSNTTLECFLKDKVLGSSLTKEIKTTSNKIVKTGNKATKPVGLPAPPTSSSPQNRIRKLKKAKQSSDRGSEKLTSVFNPSASQVSTTTSLSQLKMGKSLIGVLNLETSGDKCKHRMQLKNILDDSYSYKSPRHQSKKLSETSNQNDTSELLSHSQISDSSRGRAGTSESFTIPMRIETLETSFELAVKSSRDMKSLTYDSPRLSKKPKSAIKPFLGIDSLFKFQ